MQKYLKSKVTLYWLASKALWLLRLRFHRRICDLHDVPIWSRFTSCQCLRFRFVFRLRFPSFLLSTCVYCYSAVYDPRTLAMTVLGKYELAVSYTDPPCIAKLWPVGHCTSELTAAHNVPLTCFLPCGYRQTQQ